MKRAWWVALAVPLLLGFQGKKADFAGTWTLDLEKSVNLPKEFSTVDSYVIDVKQSGDTIIVLATMKGGGQTVPFPPFRYVADGAETHRKDTARKTERWMTARWGKDGKSVVMDSKVRLSPPKREPIELAQHDEWKRVGPSTIDVSITQKILGTDSTRTEKRIFRKQK